MTTGGQCLFCRIANGEVPSHIVYETATLVAFLDIRPIRAGHVLVVPRQHFDYFDAVPAPIAQEILAFGQRVAPMLRELQQAARVAFMFTGNDIAHAHAHVVPIVEIGDITSRQYFAGDNITFCSAPRAADSELGATAARLREVLAR